MKPTPPLLLLAALALAALCGALVAIAQPASAGHPQGWQYTQPGDCVGSHGYVSCYDWYVPHAGT